MPPAPPWMAHRLGTTVLELLMSLQTLLASLGICASSRMSWGSAAAWRCGLTGSSWSGDVPWGLDGFLSPVRLGSHVVRSAPAKRWGAFCQGLLTALGSSSVCESQCPLSLLVPSLGFREGRLAVFIPGQSGETLAGLEPGSTKPCSASRFSSSRPKCVFMSNSWMV